MSRSNAQFTRGRHRQRGVAAVFAGIALVGILTALAFAVDLAQLYQARRDLQQAANAAALDAAVVAGCSLGADDRQAEADAVAQASLTRHDVNPGWLDSVALGVVETDAGRYQFVASTENEAYAVEVAMSRPMPALVMPLFTPGADTLRARAAAMRQPQAKVAIGTYLASLLGPGTLLDQLLSDFIPVGDPARIAGYNGLVDSTVPISEVADELGLPLEELIENGDGLPPVTAPVPAPEMLEAIATALIAEGDVASAAVVQAIADELPDEPVVPIINLPPSSVGQALDDIRMSVFGTTQATVMGLFTSDDPDDPNDGNDPSPLGVDIDFADAPESQVGPPQHDVDGNAVTVAETAQAKIGLSQSLGFPVLGAVNLDVSVNAAKGRAELLAIRCSFDAEHEVDVGVTTSIATADVEMSMDVGTGLDPLLGPPLITVTLSGSLDLPTSPSSHVLTFYGPFDDPQTCSVPLQADDTCTIDSESGAGGQEIGSALITSISNDALDVCTTVGGVGPCLETNPILYPLIQGAVDDALNQLGLNAGVLGATVDGLFDTAFGVAGIALGGADVTVEDVVVPRPQRVNLE